MTVRVARNNIAGAAIRACSGRNAVTTVQCARAGTELRSVICPRLVRRPAQTPLPCRITNTVFHRIQRSIPRLQCSMYSRSRAMFRWNDGSRRAVTCHNPVMPGVTSRRRRCSRRYCPKSSRGCGLRTDHAHLASQHVPQLRKFIQAIAPQKPADAGDAGSAAILKHGPWRSLPNAGHLSIVRIGDHGAKFVADKSSALEPYSLGPVENLLRGTSA